MCDLAVGELTVDHDDPAAADLDECSVVGCLLAAGVRGAQDRRPKGLRGLDRDQCRPTRRLDDDVVGIDPLDRVRHGNAWNGCVGALGDGIDHRREQSSRGEWTGGIVNADDRCIGCDRRKAGTHRLASRCPARHSALGVHVARRHDDDDTVADGSSDLGSMIDDPPRAYQLVLLGATEA